MPGTSRLEGRDSCGFFSESIYSVVKKFLIIRRRDSIHVIRVAIRVSRCSPFELAIVLAACGGNTVASVSNTHDAADAEHLPDVAHTDTDAGTGAGADACGRCGHDGGSGECLSGGCQPVTVSSATGCALALDADNVYWVTSDADAEVLMAMPSAGGAMRALARSPHDVTSLAVDTDNLYFASVISRGSSLNGHQGSLSSVPIRGGPTVTLTTGAFNPSAIAVSGLTLYFTTLWRSNFNPDDQEPKGALMTVPVLGGLASTLVTGLEDAVDVALDAKTVYWAQSFGAGCTWGCVLGVPLAGGAPITIVSNANTTQTSVRALAVKGTDVYWTNDGISSAVMKHSLLDGDPIVLASNQYEPRAIDVNATSVYWTTLDGTVKRVPRAGGGTTTLATGQCSACAIAANDAFVFWIGCNSLATLRRSAP